MSLKILIADDSMTAQNMGKKILADAGFDVVPVSNGAAAIKKIAETKPDIIILDIYMPGYTGLEVCEKVKNNPDTAQTPVLLTVGKLEPYRPEEGAKVKAEGVIIKPFEASDLLSAIGNIAEKHNLNVPQIEPVEIAAPEEPTQSAPPQAVAVAAEAPAFADTMRLSTDDVQSMLAKGPHNSAAVSEPATEIPEFLRDASAAAAAPAAAPMFIIEEEPQGESSAPAFDLSDLTIPSSEAPAYVVDEPTTQTEVAAAVEPFSASSVPEEEEDPTASWDFGNVTESVSSVESIFVEEVPASSQVDPELETTAAAKVDAHVENLMELETAPEASVEVEQVVDPALVTDPDELMQFTIKVGTEEEPAEEAIDEVPHVENTEAAVEEAPSVAAFQSQPGFDDPLAQMGVTAEEAPMEPIAESATVNKVGDDTMSLRLRHASGLEGALQEFEAAEEIIVPPVESHIAAVEPQQAPEPVSEIVPEAQYPSNVVAEMAAVEPELAEPTPQWSEAAKHEEFASTVTDAVEAAVDDSKEETKTLAAAAGLDAAVVARAVQRVFERYKAKMVADIADELSKGE